MNALLTNQELYYEFDQQKAFEPSLLHLEI